MPGSNHIGRLALLAIILTANGFFAA